MDVVRKSELDGDEPTEDRETVPTFRPVERLWPYAELSEHHSADELAALDPDLRAALFGEPPRPFSLTVVFPPFEGPDYDRAVDLAEGAFDYRVTGNGHQRRHRACVLSSEGDRLRELYRLVSHLQECEVLVDERPVPYARELWLPLVWLILLRGERIDEDNSPESTEANGPDLSS